MPLIPRISPEISNLHDVTSHVTTRSLVAPVHQSRQPAVQLPIATIVARRREDYLDYHHPRAWLEPAKRVADVGGVAVKCLGQTLVLFLGFFDSFWVNFSMTIS